RPSALLNSPDDGRAVWDQANVYSTARPGTSVRDLDGLHEKTFTYPVDRATFGDPAIAGPGTMLAPDAGGLALLGGSRLPPIALDGAAAVAPAAPAASGGVVPGGMWGMELILMDGDCRWGLAVIYDAGTGEVERVTLIQEYTTTVDPSTPDVLGACGSVVRESRPALDAAQAAVWVTPAESAGRRVARLRAAPGGSTLLLEEGLAEAVAWTGPIGGGAGGAGGQLLLPLPDAMYLAMPPSIRGAAGTGEGAACVFEFGGLLHEAGGGLQRLLVRYSGGTGALVDVSREVFTAS
ncbi:hypothetical protein TSOC_013551, partial [Tetrabaena socialis]